MSRILFVDDEPNVLQGIERMLRPMRQEWTTGFCQGGPEALQTLASETFDVIVTDMRMPGMDGAALLNEVMQRYPDMVRIVLSGHSSKESTFKSIGVAHQFLAKPCSADELRRTIEQAFALRNLLLNASIMQTVSRLNSVPSMPRLYEALVQELQRAEASAKRVGEIVAQDPGMIAKVLQLVNSAFFGLPRHVASPEQATALLGVDTMKALVLSIEVFSQFSGAVAEGLSPETVQKHCTETAALARKIAMLEHAPRDVVDAALMAGFLHDVGKLILAQNFPAEHHAIVAHAQAAQIPWHQAEREVIGTTHAEVGGYLLGLWGLPQAIVEATVCHHEPDRALNHSFSALTALHAANVLVLEQTGGAAGAAESLDVDYLARVGVAERVDTWRAEYRGAATVGEGAA
jgi:HD-like signal output (HDOD) protein